MEKTLPPLPRSDEEAMSNNVYDGNYKTTSRSFWGENEVIRITPQEFKKCDHRFEATVEGVKCIKCHFGLIGQIEIRDGKLFHNSEPLGI